MNLLLLLSQQTPITLSNGCLARTQHDIARQDDGRSILSINPCRWSQVKTLAARIILSHQPSIQDGVLRPVPSQVRHVELEHANTVQDQFTPPRNLVLPRSLGTGWFEGLYECHGNTCTILGQALSVLALFHLLLLSWTPSCSPRRASVQVSLKISDASHFFPFLFSLLRSL